MKYPQSQSGVTLPELMTAMAVIAIMLSLSAPSYSEFINKRKVAGAANLVAMFFENVKMESIKRNEFASITFNQSDDGTEWCLGAVIGREVTCDCMAETPVCLIDSTPTTLTNESHAQLASVITNFTDGMVSYDPIRGVLTDPADSVTIAVQHNTEDFLVNVSVNGTGRIRKCTPSGHKYVGYATCI